MILDTNILILYLNGDEQIVNMVSEWQKYGRALFVSSISVAEVFSLPGLAPGEIDTIRKFRHNA